MKDLNRIDIIQKKYTNFYFKYLKDDCDGMGHHAVTQLLFCVYTGLVKGKGKQTLVK